MSITLPDLISRYFDVQAERDTDALLALFAKVQLDVDVGDGALLVTVGDDGVGGADPTRGSGLLGLKDRAETVGGTVSVASRQGAGTTLIAELPLDSGTR